MVVLALVFMLLGAAAVTAGTFLVSPPASLVVGGALMILAGLGIVRVLRRGPVAA